MNDPQYDLFQSRSARDEGIALVDSSEPNWAPDALEYIKNVMPRGMEADNQTIQRLIMQHGCPAPKKHNSWGSLFLKAKRAKVLAHVGYTKATRIASHARVISIYRRI